MVNDSLIEKLAAESFRPTTLIGVCDMIPADIALRIVREHTAAQDSITHYANGAREPESTGEATGRPSQGGSRADASTRKDGVCGICEGTGLKREWFNEPGSIGFTTVSCDHAIPSEISVIKDEEYYDKRKHEIFEEWATLTPYLPTARDGDGEYESDATKAYFMCFEFAFKRGVLFGVISDSATRINGELCDRVAELEKQLEGTREPVSLIACAMALQGNERIKLGADLQAIAKAVLEAAGVKYE